jgi:hypothetical protein
MDELSNGRAQICQNRNIIVLKTVNRSKLDIKNEHNYELLRIMRLFQINEK